jgi:hypothetical protein
MLKVLLWLWPLPWLRWNRYVHITLNRVMVNWFIHTVLFEYTEYGTGTLVYMTGEFNAKCRASLWRPRHAHIHNTACMIWKYRHTRTCMHNLRKNKIQGRIGSPRQIWSRTAHDIWNIHTRISQHIRIPKRLQQHWRQAEKKPNSLQRIKTTWRKCTKNSLITGNSEAVAFTRRSFRRSCCGRRARWCCELRACVCMCLS